VNWALLQETFIIIIQDKLLKEKQHKAHESSHMSLESQVP